MRVRVAKSTKAYWEYAIREFDKGEELLGDLARHLLANTPDGTVEVLEPDPEPVAPVVPVEDEDPAVVDGSDAPPADGTVGDLMAWIGDDPERAAAALAAEQAKDKPRATVIKRLGGATAE